MSKSSSRRRAHQDARYIVTLFKEGVQVGRYELVSCDKGTAKEEAFSKLFRENPGRFHVLNDRLEAKVEAG